MSGIYKVTTSMTGGNALEVDVTVKSEEPLRNNQMFGVGWGIGYGPNNTFTESYISVYSWWQSKKSFAWGSRSIRSNMPIDFMRRNPFAASAVSRPEIEPIWKPVVNEINSNSVRVWAWRPFEQKD